MKASTTALRDTITNSNAIKAVPACFIEWEHNRFSPIASIGVTPAQANDPEWLSIYDLNSIGLPNRPRTGIAKARFDDNNMLKMQSTYRDVPQQSRFYIASDDDPYKYWSSTQKTGTTAGGDGGYAFSTPLQITLMYTDPVVANKLAVGFETSYAKPKTFTVFVTTNGTTWTNVASTPVLNASGQSILWRNQDDQWTSTVDYINPIAIKGVRLTVSSMTLPNARLDVLQLGMRLENDVSEYVEDYGKSFEISDRSIITPLGQASSNTSKISINNMDGRFNNDNESSLYYGLIGKRAKVTLNLLVDASGEGGSTAEPLRELTMWTDTWGGQEELSVELDLKDTSIILQEIPMPHVYWENLTVGAVIWQTMDILGLSNYLYIKDPSDSGQVVPFFWPEKDQTVWDLFQDLSSGTQTAIFFDEYDILQVVTRQALFNPSSPVDWNFDAIQNGQKLADVVSLSSNDDIVANKVEVNYKPAKFSDFNNGLPKMEVVWQPEEDTVVLRASPLIKDLSSSATDLWIKAADTAVWPYSSTINIRGEILHYKGKEYAWRKPGGGIGYEIAYSQEDKDKIDLKSDQAMMWANAWTGRLMIDERGIGGSGVATHKIKPAGYTGIVTSVRNTYLSAWDGGRVYSNGKMILTGPSWSNIDYHYLVKHEAVIPVTGTTYGARLTFSVSQTEANNSARAGLFFAGNQIDAGYYLEIATTETVEAEKRVNGNEVKLEHRGSNAVPLAFDKGTKLNVVKGVSYDIDVRHVANSNGTATITAYINGVFVQDWIVSAGARPPQEGKFGVFCRGRCHAEFEYIYAVYKEDAVAPDTSSYLDLVRGDFTSGYIEREWKYGTYTSANRGPRRLGSPYIVAVNSRENYAYDEFGPVVHEIREFDIVFDDQYVPVLHSYLYLSNDSQIVCTDYISDPFGARFTLVNATRQNAIVTGEDTLTFGTDNSISQKMFVYGRALYQEDEFNIIKEDAQSQRINGIVGVTFDNRFVQTEATADGVAQWVIDQWNVSTDEIEVEINGNPLIQLGDLVTMNYPIKGMYPSTHRYYIVALSNNFSEGLESNVVLRRAR